MMLLNEPDPGVSGAAVRSDWDPTAAGVLLLPSGRLVRGRALRRPLPERPPPDFGLYLLGREPEWAPWRSRWLRWRDFRLPSDRADASHVLAEAWERAGHQRVEVTCGGGRGRTGTALACLGVLDGVAAGELWRTCASTTTLTQWKRRGSAGTSPASAGFRSAVGCGWVR
jgi:hypothetical protein